MYNKFLFIGLGGSGGKTLRFLKDQIRRWMREHGIEGDIPAGWQFLHIDVQPRADGDEINDRVPHLAGDEYLGLVPPGITLRAVQSQLDSAANRRAELRTWRVDPPAMRVDIQPGAGQYRAIGHTIGTLYVNALKDGIEAKYRNLNSARASGELNSAYTQANGTATVAPGGTRTYVFVVSSLAGGTGAGLLSTVCDLVRSIDAAVGSNVFGILYTSEVFNELPPANRAGVHGNGLAAICELLNGHWWGADPGADDDVVVKPIEDPFLHDAGAVGMLTHSGPAYPFLVGLENAEGVNFGTFDALYEGVGRALLSWVTDEEVAGSFVSYTIGNWQTKASTNVTGDALVDSGEAAAIGYPPFSALGFARVSLGTDHFERYAVDRAVRHTEEHLVDYHWNSDEATRVSRELGVADPDVLAERLAEAHGGWFRAEVGLDEDDHGVAPIMGDLSTPGGGTSPTGGIDRTAERCTEYQGQIQQAAALDAGGNRAAGEWRNLIDGAVQYCFGDYAKLVRADLDERSREWVAAVEERALSAVETAIKRYGLRIASRLCADLASHLRTSVVEHLRGVSEDCRDWSSGWQHEAATDLAGVKGKLAAGHASLLTYLETAVHRRSFELDALIAERAADLASEAAVKLFEPLSGAIEDAHARLQGERRSEGIDSRPPANEFSLIDAAEHRALFDRLLKQTFDRDHAGKLRDAVIGCELCDRSSGYKFINPERSWVPGASWSGGAPANVAVTVCRTRDGSSRELLVRSATDWLRDKGRPFGELLGLSLRAALDTASAAGDDVIAAERQQYSEKFLTCLDSAIEAAAPLLELDPNLRDRVGTDDGKGLERHLSKLPFGPGRDGAHPMQERVEDRLATKINAQRLAALMNDDERRTHIDIATQLAAPQSVLAIKSLLAPIAADWGRQKGGNPVKRKLFWQCRRTRPLQRFIPVPQAHLRCLVRGWFTAGILGLLDTSADDGTILIARGGGRDPAGFPNPSLSPIRRADRLGPVLEALGLAYVEVAERQGLEPLQPYVALRNLGTSADGAILRYDTLNPRLARWIETGGPDPDALTDMNPPHLAQATSFDDRRSALIAALEEVSSEYRDDYKTLSDEWDRNHGRLSTAPLWTGLWPLIGEELQRLREAVKSHTPDSGLR